MNEGLREAYAKSDNVAEEILLMPPVKFASPDEITNVFTPPHLSTFLFLRKG